jgi:hypothetical protein
LKNKLYLFFKLFFYLFRNSKVEFSENFDVLFYCGDGDRQFKHHSTYFSPLIDSIGDELSILGYKTLTVSAPFSLIYNKKAYGNVIDITGKYSRALLLHYCNKLFNFNNSKNYVVEFWTNTLACIEPKIIIGIQPPAELCVASKRRNIWIADLQHGVISGEGYYSFRSYKIYGNNALPDSILCWDLKSFNWVKKNISLNINPIITGNPWFAKFNDTSDKLVKDHIISCLPFFSSLPSNRYNFLVTLQCLEDSHTCYGMPKGLIDFISESGQSYNWLIKPHPLQINNSFRENFKKFVTCKFPNNNIFWDELIEIPLPLILENTNLHFTTHSAVTIEASWFGIKTALLSKNVFQLREYFSFEINNKMAFVLIDSVESIKTWISKNINNIENNKNSINFNYKLLIDKLN